MIFVRVASFPEWREKARHLLLAGVPPAEVDWEGEGLFAEELPPPGVGRPHVPKAFMEAAERAACYRDSRRWGLLYRILWRIQHESRQLLEVSSDDDVVALRHMVDEVRRDSHKMKAFVRFRKLGDEYIAWHEQSHLVLERTAPFFARRFGPMRWAILTPDSSAYWDGKELRFGPGVARAQAPEGDEMEELWKTYYTNIFNPARVKVSAMKAEMPVKYWKTMPETALIPGLLAGAEQRVREMIRVDSTSLEERPDLWAARLLEAGAPLGELGEAVMRCRGCELCEKTHAVFGAGSPTAPLVFVGEQPGDQEDKQGKPFVGPAGQILRQTLGALRIPVEHVYLTNAVKHFHWEDKGNSRLHKRASPTQIRICRPWAEAEIQTIRPRVVCCLGVTAAQSLLRPDFRLTRQRGQLIESPLADKVLATFHPSYLLRLPDPEERARQRALFDQDIALAYRLSLEP
ncbi:MAG: UdgX family uracil-DNA binding protein [Candidatus Eremiobacteraeota bacterium]|nr:UdgX family uracil-DNA binding protein [Candidatus Eremiobacteraeota bacterium]